MSTSERRVGWFGVPTEEARQPDAPRTVAAGASIEPSTPGPPAGPQLARKPVRSETKVTLGLAVISGLVIVGGVTDLVASLQVGSDAGDRAIAAIGAVIGVAVILLGIGLFTRRELARRIYLVLAAIGYLEILGASSKVSAGFTLLALVLQTIPVVFLLRPSVSATFT